MEVGVWPVEMGVGPWEVEGRASGVGGVASDDGGWPLGCGVQG